MDLGLRGKVAIVGGSSRGLGFGCASVLVREGAHVVVSAAHDSNALEAARADLARMGGGEVLAVRANMGVSEDTERLVQETVERFGGVDILVNNSGGPPAGAFTDLDDATWVSACEGTLLSVVRMCRLVVPSMRLRGGGRIVNIASLVVREPSEQLVLSGAFRAGVVNFSKAISRSLITDHITINTVFPGSFRTERATALLMRTAAKEGITLEQAQARSMARLPLGRFQEPEELGNLVAFLCSGLAGGITGTTITIDGGSSKGVL
ncbi:MAG: SDR family oxidoreductase [bacterium]|nr:SDR family oxidoreductase [bacterium]